MSALPDPDFSLTASGNLRRRAVVSRLIETGATAAAVLAVAVLGILVYYVASQGIGAISWTFLTSSLPPPFGTGSGIGPAIAGTGEIVAFATLIALPVGVLTALYLSEFAGGRVASVVKLLVDMLNGIPTIVTAVVVYGLIVLAFGESGFAGSVALSIVMVPLITRASLEALVRVPGTLREAADALGVGRWRTVVGVIIPGAMGGILTASILAAARAAGETAPLLICDSLFGPGLQLNPFKAMPNIPFAILALTEQGSASATQTAWGAAFVLLFAILVANVGARALVARSNRRSGR
ncbi:MAG: phosphate ABC transporter permease PstA [Solirubrobacteraceae bacterium]